MSWTISLDLISIVELPVVDAIIRYLETTYTHTVIITLRV